MTDDDMALLEAFLRGDWNSLGTNTVKVYTIDAPVEAGDATGTDS